MTTLTWRDHWKVTLLIVAVEVLVFVGSFVTNPQRGDVFPVQPVVFFFCFAQVFIACVCFSVLRLFRPSKRWWLAVVQLIGCLPLIEIPRYFWGLHQAVEHVHAQASATCAGVEIQSWRIIPRGEPSGPAFELHIRSGPGLPGPLFIEFIDADTAADATGHYEGAIYPDVLAPKAGIETGKEATATVRILHIFHPVGYFKFALCPDEADDLTCAFYSYGRDPSPPGHDPYLRCPKLPAPTGPWPPRVDSK
jgi:uncharacterized membrane protein YhaH (DUF805 family)